MIYLVVLYLNCVKCFSLQYGSPAGRPKKLTTQRRRGSLIVSLHGYRAQLQSKEKEQVVYLIHAQRLLAALQLTDKAQPDSSPFRRLYLGEV